MTPLLNYLRDQQVRNIQLLPTNDLDENRYRRYLAWCEQIDVSPASKETYLRLNSGMPGVQPE